MTSGTHRRQRDDGLALHTFFRLFRPLSPRTQPHPTESLNTRPTPLSLIDLRKATRPIQFSALLAVEGAGGIGKRLATAAKLELLGTPAGRAEMN